MASLKRQVAEGYAYLLGRSILVRGIGIAVTLLLVRYLTRFEYGLYALFTSAMGIGIMFFMGSLGTVVVADVSRELGSGRKDHAKALLLRYFQFIIGIAILISLAFYLSSYPLTWRYGQKVGELAVAIALIIPLYAVRNILITTFHSHSKFGYMAALPLIESLGRLGFVVVVVVILRQGLMGAVYSQLFGPLLGVLIMLYPAFHTLKHLLSTPRARTGLFYTMLRGHGKYMIAFSSVRQVRDQALPWIVQFFLGVEAVAVFTVAKRGMEVFQMLLNSLSQVYIPLVSAEASKGVERVNEIMNRSIKYLGMLSLLLILGAGFLARWLISTLFGELYLDSVMIFRVLLAALILFSIRSVLLPVFMAYKSQRHIFLSSLASLAALLILTPILIPIFGLVGAAAGYIIAIAIFVALLTRYLKHVELELEVRASQLLSIDDYDRALFKKAVSMIRGS